MSQRTIDIYVSSIKIPKLLYVFDNWWRVAEMTTFYFYFLPRNLSITIFIAFIYCLLRCRNHRSMCFDYTYFFGQKTHSKQTSPFVNNTTYWRIHFIFLSSVFPTPKNAIHERGKKSGRLRKKLDFHTCLATGYKRRGLALFFNIEASYTFQTSLRT